MGCASDPPSNGMVQTVPVTWHAHDGSRMHGLPEPTVGPLGQRNESVSGINTELDYRNEERENMCFPCSHVGTGRYAVRHDAHPYVEPGV